MPPQIKPFQEIEKNLNTLCNHRAMVWYYEIDFLFLRTGIRYMISWVSEKKICAGFYCLAAWGQLAV